MPALIVFFGAGIGGVARYLLGGWIQAATGPAFPWGTFTINVTGSFILAVAYATLDGSAAAAEWRLFLGVGICGGYTTFSTFSYETVRLMQDGDWTRASAYVIASVVGSVAAALIGLRIGTSLLARS